MKNVIALSLCLVGMLACSRSGKNSSPAASDPYSHRTANAHVPLLNDTFLLKKTYSGENLILVYPHARNFGYLKLLGADAKALFHSLQVITTKGDGNRMWLPSRIRQGNNVTCFEQRQKATPEVLGYECSIYLDYKMGLLSLHTDKIKKDESVPYLKETYKSQNLWLVAGHSRSFSSLTIHGEDARALYHSLKIVPEGSATHWFKKKSRHLSCSKDNQKQSLREAYSCRIYFNYRTGALIPTIL